MHIQSDLEPMMAHPYTVALVAAEGLPSAVRIAAEASFAASLERSLGASAQVAETLRAWTAANESTPADLDKTTVETAMHWPRAASIANDAAFRAMGGLPGAHFEVTLTRI